MLVPILTRRLGWREMNRSSMGALAITVGMLVAGLILTETTMTTEVATSSYRVVGWLTVVIGGIGLLIFAPTPFSELGWIPTFAVLRTKSRRIVLSPIRLIPWRLDSPDKPVHAVLEDRGAFSMGPTLKYEYALVAGEFEWGFLMTSPLRGAELDTLQRKFSEVGVIVTTDIRDDHAVGWPYP